MAKQDSKAKLDIRVWLARFYYRKGSRGMGAQKYLLSIKKPQPNDFETPVSGRTRFWVAEGMALAVPARLWHKMGGHHLKPGVGPVCLAMNLPPGILHVELEASR